MGLALLWKSRGPGSQQLLGEFKRSLGLLGNSRTGIGHTGTLDPFAEGLLCVGIEEGTKLISPLMGLPKTYRATLLFGATSDSLDDTGQLQSFDLTQVSARLAALSAADLESFLQKRLGSFNQLPPQFSAVHVDGKRAYEWARLGVQKALTPRICYLLDAHHVSFSEMPWNGQPHFEWVFEARVSSGTYIRSFARDWGLELSGFPGLLTKLVRLKVGDFELKPQETLRWLDVTALSGIFDRHFLTQEQAEGVRRFGRWEARPGSPRPALLMDPKGEVVAWTESQTGRLGRVFTEDPLKTHSVIASREGFV